MECRRCLRPLQVLRSFACMAFLAGLPAGAPCQENYEIQVYGSETMTPGFTMVELHSNFTGDGRKHTENGVLPTDHAFHETLEITHGFTSWFETGFYVFTSVRSGDGWQWVGDHIRPRVGVPADWDWPVGLSLSAEFGYQQPGFSEDTWTLEVRPIIDKQWGPWYFSLNPVLGKSFEGVNEDNGFDFAPNAKASYDLTEVITAGVEYYGSLGEVGHFDPVEEQEHMIVPALDLNFSPSWEFNFGVGFGLTHATDNLIVKMIVGWKF